MSRRPGSSPQYSRDITIPANGQAEFIAPYSHDFWFVNQSTGAVTLQKGGKSALTLAAGAVLKDFIDQGDSIVLVGTAGLVISVYDTYDVKPIPIGKDILGNIVIVDSTGVNKANVVTGAPVTADPALVTRSLIYGDGGAGAPFLLPTFVGPPSGTQRLLGVVFPSTQAISLNNVGTDPTNTARPVAADPIAGSSPSRWALDVFLYGSQSAVLAQNFSNVLQVDATGSGNVPADVTDRAGRLVGQVGSGTGDSIQSGGRVAGPTAGANISGNVTAAAKSYLVYCSLDIDGTVAITTDDANMGLYQNAVKATTLAYDATNLASVSFGPFRITAALNDTFSIRAIANATATANYMATIWAIPQN